MLDGSDAIAAWPLLMRSSTPPACAAWVSIHNGGGVGIGFRSTPAWVVVRQTAPKCQAPLRARSPPAIPVWAFSAHADAGVRRAMNSLRLTTSISG